MEFVIGGLAAASAGVFTNPIEVLKHHMEMNRKSPVNEKYKKFLYAGYNMTKKSGIKSFQKGFTPAIFAHITSYGMKLGTYQFAQANGLTTDANGHVLVPLSVGTSVAGGILGQYMSSPFYLVKTVSELEKDGKYSDKHSYSQIVGKIYKEQGFRGFFRGATASLPRAFIGTSQLTSFAVAKENFSKSETLKDSPMMTTLLASSIAGLVLSIAMTPFDMVLTKLYKQAIGSKQQTPQYKGFLDCASKIYAKNGIKPFYSGVGPLYLKLGPHTILCLVFWEEFKDLYENYNKNYDKYWPDLNFYDEKFGEVVVHEDSRDLYW